MKLSIQRLPLSLLLVAAACGGPVDDELEISASELQTTEIDRPNVRIPDNDPSGVSRSLNIDAGTARVIGVRVAVRIQHTYRGDLRVTLQSPSGQSVVLHDQTGGSANNLSFDRRLQDFNGEAAAGDWVLNVSDNERRDTGRLIAWGIRVEDEPAPTDPCEAFVCEDGFRCEPQEVVCVRAPCDPVPTCVEVERGPFCGSRGVERYCDVGDYCHHEPAQICGFADAIGECRATPEACYEIYQPVCGCDNVTYPNDCYANAGGTSVQHTGECRTTQAAYWDEKTADFGTENPYRNFAHVEETYYPPPDATRMRVHFTRFSTERNYDFLNVKDAQGTVLTRWHGNLGSGVQIVDLPANGPITLDFTSDYSVTAPGFHVNAISWYRQP